MTTTGYVDGVTSHDNDVNGLMSVEMPETKLKLLTTTKIIKITNSWKKYIKKGCLSLKIILLKHHILYLKNVITLENNR